MYRIVFSNDAKKDLKELSKKAPLNISAKYKDENLRQESPEAICFIKYKVA